MKPIDFKHRNVIYAKNQDDYNSLPALKLDTTEGEAISCWKLSFFERIKLLFTGKLWLSLMCFNGPLTPRFMSVNRKDVYLHPDDSETFFNKLKRKFTKK